LINLNMLNISLSKLLDCGGFAVRFEPYPMLHVQLPSRFTWFDLINLNK